MYPSEVKVVQGAKILWEGMIREYSFNMTYTLGIDDDWSEANRRASDITEQTVQDWLNAMSERGRVELIDPVTFIQTFERGMVNELSYRYPEIFERVRVHEFEDTRELAGEASKRIAPAEEGSCMSKAVKLVFDATGSQERAIRILRATEEPYTFVHQGNGDWSCTSQANGKPHTYRLFVDIHRSAGYCSCQDFQQRGLAQKMPCKHIYGYVIQTNKVSWKAPGQEE